MTPEIMVAGKAAAERLWAVATIASDARINVSASDVRDLLNAYGEAVAGCAAKPAP